MRHDCTLSWMRSGRVRVDWSRFRDETTHASVGMMLERVWPMDTTVGILVKWEVTSATVLAHVDGKDEWNGIVSRDHEKWMSYPGRSPLADKGSGGVRAGAEVKRLI